MNLRSYFDAKPAEFIELLQDNVIQLDEAIDVYVSKNQLGYSDKYMKKLFYSIIRLVKTTSNFSNVEQLARLFDDDLELAIDIVKSKYVEFDFPIISENKKDCSASEYMGKGIVLFTSRLFTNMPNKKSEIEIVINLSGKTFSVIFDRDFSGNSYMLSLYVAVAIEKFFDDVTFTGGLNNDGKVLPAEKLEEKQSICKSLHKNLISFLDIPNMDGQKLVNFLKDHSVNVPLILSYKNRKTSSELLEEAYKKLSNLASFYYERNIVEKILGEKLIYQNHSIGDGDFKNEIQNASKILRKILAKNWVPHIAIDGPASFAMGLGISYGIYYPIVGYHFQNNNYYRVLDLSTEPKKLRAQKVNVDNLSKISFKEIEEIGDGEDIVFIIHLSSIDPTPDVIQFVTESGISAKGMLIYHKTPDIIEPSDWSTEVVEIKSVIEYAKSKFKFRNAHFFLNMPVLIAFGLGIALGQFIKGSVYNYDINGTKATSKYYKAFNINELAFGDTKL